MYFSLAATMSANSAKVNLAIAISSRLDRVLTGLVYTLCLYPSSNRHKRDKTHVLHRGVSNAVSCPDAGPCICAASNSSHHLQHATGAIAKGPVCVNMFLMSLIVDKAVGLRYGSSQWSDLCSVVAMGCQSNKLCPSSPAPGLATCVSVTLQCVSKHEPTAHY